MERWLDGGKQGAEGGLGSGPGVEALGLMNRLVHRYPDRSEVTIRLGEAAGLRWRRRHMHSNSLWLGMQEPRLQKAIAAMVGPGSRVFDIGAGEGFMALLAGRLTGPQGWVVAVDERITAIEGMREQFALNEFVHCRTCCATVGDAPGPSTTTLDELAAEHGWPTFVRLNVGHRIEVVLDGGSRVMHDAQADLLVEVDGYHRADVEARLTAAGYRLLDPDGRESGRSYQGRFLLARRRR